MLRWFKNYMEVVGPQNRINSLIETNFDFDCIVPEPHLDDDNAKIYNWRCEHWGSVWISNLRLISRCKSGAQVFTSFDSFAAPPIPIWQALENQGFSVRASFDEALTQMSGDYRQGRSMLFYPDGVVTIANNEVNYEFYPTLDEFLDSQSNFDKLYLISAQAQFAARTSREYK